MLDHRERSFGGAIDPLETYVAAESGHFHSDRSPIMEHWDAGLTASASHRKLLVDAGHICDRICSSATTQNRVARSYRSVSTRRVLELLATDGRRVHQAALGDGEGRHAFGVAGADRPGVALSNAGTRR